MNNAANKIGQSCAKTGSLNRRPSIRMVVGGWPKVPEQPYLVRGSAGTDCKGNLGYPLLQWVVRPL